MTRDWKKIGIVVGSLLVLGAVGLFIFKDAGFSTVETTFGTVQYDLVDSGITDVTNLVTTDVTGGYFRYSIVSGADVRSVQTTTISIEDAPTGTSFGYSLLYYYDNDSATNEMVFLKFEIKTTDVRWDYVNILTGSGSLIKKMEIEPATGTATFFVFVDETEIAGAGSIFLQFVGWHYATNNVVAVTGYSELNYSIGAPLETTDITQPPAQVSAFLTPIPMIIAIIVFGLLKKRNKKE